MGMGSTADVLYDSIDEVVAQNHTRTHHIYTYIDDVLNSFDEAIDGTTLTGDEADDLSLAMDNVLSGAKNIWQNDDSTGVFDYIDSEEDVELAQAKINAINAKLNFINTNTNAYLKRMEAKKSEGNYNWGVLSNIYNTHVSELQLRAKHCLEAYARIMAEIDISLKALAAKQPMM